MSTRYPVDLAALRVVLREDVHSDLPSVFPRVTAERGTHPARLNPHGAVSVYLPATGQWLGVKPGEFDFACPHVDRAATHLGGYGARGKLWTVVGPDGSATLERDGDGWAWCVS